jgi:hypothetical protein
MLPSEGYNTDTSRRDKKQNSFLLLKSVSKLTELLSIVLM